MAQSSMACFMKAALKAGFRAADFNFVWLCDPIPQSIQKSDSRKWAHVEPNGGRVRRECGDAKVVIALGALAARTVTGRPVKITEARGVAHDGLVLRTEVMTAGEAVSRGLCNEAEAAAVGDMLEVDIPVKTRVFPMLPPAMITKVPAQIPAFESDFVTLRRLMSNDFVPEAHSFGEYKWVRDLSELKAAKPAIVSVDTETHNFGGGSALNVRHPDTAVLTVQFCWEAGKAIVLPVSYPDERIKTVLPDYDRIDALVDLIDVLEDPTIRKVGHNLKYDVQVLRNALGIELQGWTHDTMQLAHVVDEEMRRKSLDECARRWLPDMAGYADSFNSRTDKGDMLAVEMDDMLRYAGGDADAAFRLCGVLANIVRKDAGSWNVYKRITMPGVIAFERMERGGMLVSRDRLRDFSARLNAEIEKENLWLLENTPGKVKAAELKKATEKAAEKLKTDAGKDRARGRIDAAEVLKFSRDDFVREILFGADGFRLQPVQFTASTEDLEEPEDRVASASAKTHLPYFFGHATCGEYVRRLATLRKLGKMRNTYVGDEEKRTGFWKYIDADGMIHPRFGLHTTVTGRTNSTEPNGQNFPTRGEWAKPYLSIFVAPPGWKIVAADLSQIELRIAAWMSGDAEMLSIYLANGDIHSATAKIVANLSDAEWDALDKKKKKELRTKAKVVNFGFIYGMSWRKFLVYAFTDYGVVFSEQEAEAIRTRFFQRYSRLLTWHNDQRSLAHKHRAVRALHGSVRHVEGVLSDDTAAVAEAERQAINSPVQRMGSDIGVAALARLSAQRQDEWLRPLCFIHDALYFLVKDGHERAGVEAVVYAMQSVPLKEWFGIQSPISIVAEPDIGLSFGEKVEIDDVRGLDRAGEEWGKLPDWFRTLEQEQGICQYSPTVPSWWRPELDMVCEAAFWS
jgi:DNA polymerase I-like protein with 3'-5' exonuclease and polymerase domains